MKKVLSIDGGGIRGLIPALVLAEIEEKTNKRISELFDLIVGTSTGGILALALNVKDENNNAKYTAKDVATMYSERGKEIFDNLIYIPIISDILSDEKYGHQGLEKVLMDYLSDNTMEQSIKNVMLTAYDINNRTTIFMKSWKPKHKELLMRDCARATSAAPTYFEPKQMEIVDENKKEKTLIDGGVFINNPAMSAYVEAQKSFQDEDVLIVSLGTGELTRPYDYEDAKDWSRLNWLRPMMSCMFDGMTDATDYQLNQLLPNNYYRFQTKLNEGYDELDNVSETNLKALERKADEIIKKPRFKKLLEKL